MLQTVLNSFRVPDLRRRLIITVLLLAACRVGVFIPIPGVDLGAVAALFRKVQEQAGVALMSFVDIFSGGGLSQCAVFGLGVMPYISASIIFQLLVQVIPALKKLSEEGEAGRQKINQYTRYATVLLCLFQAGMILSGFRASDPAIFSGFGAGMMFLGALLMTAGTLFLMWVGEQIDEYGIGNGVSLIIMANILSRFPIAVRHVAVSFRFTMSPASEDEIGILTLAFLIASFIAVIVGIVMITQGQRRIPFQQAKQMRGRRIYGGLKHYLPLQVNAANVIPIIFAQSLLIFPTGAANVLASQTEPGTFLNAVGRGLQRALTMGSFTYNVTYIALIFFFCYFWTAITFNPTDMAKNLKEHGSFIPGIRPGKRTAEYLERVMTRITLPGAASLSLIAIFPSLLGSIIGVKDFRVMQFFGGTTILIAVGVALDLVKKIESQLLMRHYEGFTRGRKRRF